MTALALADVASEPSEAAAVQLEKFESEHGRALPAAVREWYSLSAATTILESAKSGDYAYPVERLGGRQSYYWPPDNGDWPDGVEEQEEREFDPVTYGWLPFLEDYSGVYCLAVCLDGSDDPPVLLSWDGVQPDSWVPHADSFSQWVYTWVWDAALFGDEAGSALTATVQQVTEADIETLAQVLDVRPVTMWGTSKSLRFVGAGEEQRLRIESPTAAGDAWKVYFWATTDDLLFDLFTTTRSVLSITDVSAYSSEPNSRARRVLERLAT